MVQWDFEATSVAVLGAGFSRAASDGETPLMKGYFDRLDLSRYKELFEFVLDNGCDQGCRKIGEANVEDVLLALEQIRTSERRLLRGWLDKTKDSLPAIRRQLGEYTRQRLADNLVLNSENWAINLLATTGFQTTYISMNYDTIAELTLCRRKGTTHCSIQSNCPHCRMQNLLSKSCGCSSRSEEIGDLWRGTILKPHGSIAWSRCVNKKCCVSECLVPECDCSPPKQKRCSHCNQVCDVAMIFPTMAKRLDELPEIAAMWQASHEALVRAESVLFFGFSLPDSDKLFSRLLQDAFRSKQHVKIGVIDLQPDTVIARIQKVVPHGCCAEFIPLEVPRFGSPEWFSYTSNALVEY